MRIDVVGRNMEITDAIREHAEEKAQKLPRYFNGVQQITFTFEQDNHHQHGNFEVELVIDVVKHDDFVARASGDDLYATIDLVVQKGARQLTDHKERLRSH